MYPEVFVQRFRVSVAIPLILSASLSACGATGGVGAPTLLPTLSSTFDVSSESSLYVVRGQFAGSAYLGPRKVVIAIKRGSVLATVADPNILLRAVIAGTGVRGWRKVSESEPQSLGAFNAGERKELTDSLVLNIPLARDFDPQRHWLAFQFALSDAGTTYACSARNLAGPDSLSAERARQLRTFYPLAC